MNYRFYRHQSLASTNDEAKRLAALGEPEGAVVIAEAQTAGRGRSGRTWITLPGAAIAVSIILRPRVPPAHMIQIALLGGLAAREGIFRATGLPAQIKWPNDVLVRGKKVAGVLAEAAFDGERVEYVVLGIGVNVNAGPPPDLRLEYPATSLAAETGFEVERDLVREAILSALNDHYPQLGTPALAAAWSEHLAMRGQAVQVIGVAETIAGQLEGVTGEGALAVRLNNGEIRTILAGDVHLRQA